MNASPDAFYSVRYHRSAVRGASPQLQSMEFGAHNKCIDEYGNDMLSHLLSIQSKTKPNLALIQQQPEINLKMRPLLLDFLMDVINKLQLSKSTFPLCVNLIDRYCSTRIVKKQHYQLLGLTALWISCKNSDSKIKIPTLNDLCKMCCNCYNKKLFLEMENHLLKSLSWLISFPTFDLFIDIFCKEYATTNLFNGLDFHLKQVKYVAIYICELIQFYPNVYFNYTLAEISISLFLISLLVLNFKISIPNEIIRLNSLINKNESEEIEIISVKNFGLIHKALLKIVKCPPPSLKLKYFSKSNKNLNLMQFLIKYCNLNLTPISLNPLTPKNSIHKLNQLPPTPLSSNISPNCPQGQGQGPIGPNAQSPFLPSPRLSPHNTYHQYFNSSPPFTPLDVRAGQILDNTTRSFQNTSNIRSEYTTASVNVVFGATPATVPTSNGFELKTEDSKNSSENSDSTLTTNSSNNAINSHATNQSQSFITSLDVAATIAPGTIRKRSYQLLSIDTEKKLDINEEGLKRNKSQKPIFFIN